MLIVPPIEELKPGPVDPPRDDPRVVHRALRQLADPERPEPLGNGACQLSPGPHPGLTPAGLERSRIGVLVVQHLQPVGEARVEIAQHDFVVPAVGGLTGLGRVAFGVEERLRRAVADELGKALIEWRRTLHVERIVGDLVEHRCARARRNRLKWRC